MPAPLLIPALLAAVGSFLAQALIALGIGLVSYNFVMPEIVALIQAQLSGVPPEVYAVLALTKFDVAITIILSAVAANLSMRVSVRRTPASA